MNTTADRYAAARRPLTILIDAVPAASWSSSSPCEGWTTRDVLRHLIDTQRELLAQHGVTLDEFTGVDADPARAWREHSDQVHTAIADDAVPSIAYDGYFGPTTLGATLEQFYIWDMYVHRWDIARAAGLDAALTEPELDLIEHGADRFGDAIYMDGICRPGVDAPADASRLERVLARLGRVTQQA